MAQVFILHLPVRLELLHVGAEYSYFLIQKMLEIEVVKLSQPKLIVVVIQRFFRNTHSPGRLGETHFFNARFATGEMERPPLLDQFYRFSYGSLFAAVLLLPPLLQARLHPAVRLSILRLFLPPLEPHHDYLRLQVISRDEAALLSSNFSQRHEGVSFGVVDGDLMVLEGTELREDGGEVDSFFRRRDLHVQQQRLLRLFLLENKSAHPVLRPVLDASRHLINFRQLKLHSKNIYLLKILIFIDRPHTPHFLSPPDPCLARRDSLPILSFQFLRFKVPQDITCQQKFCKIVPFFDIGLDNIFLIGKSCQTWCLYSPRIIFFCNEISPFRKDFTSWGQDDKC